MPDHSELDKKPVVAKSKLILSSPLEKHHPGGGDYMTFLERPQTFLSKEQKEKLSSGNHFHGADITHSLSMSSLDTPDQKITSQSNVCMHQVTKGFCYDNNIFSSSLSEAFSNKLRLMSNDAYFVKSLDATNSKFVEDEPVESMQEIEAKMIGDLLPNDEDLLSGAIGDIDCVAQINSGDEDDLFYSGGGMEMEYDESFNRSRASGFPIKRASDCQIVDSLRNIVGSELALGEQSTRALIVRNVNSSVEETELRVLFEQFGDIHVFYTANRHLGFMMVSYYDLRAARNAKSTLHDRLLRQQKLDIQFYYPKDNGPDKENNHATLTVVNLDSCVSKEQLHQIFGSYGEIKEIFHDPCNQNQRTVEFYDIRAAEVAIRSLNMSVIAGKRIMIEHGFPRSGWKRKSGSPSRSLSVSSGPATYVANTSMGNDNGVYHNSIHQSLNSPLVEIGFPRISTMSQNQSSPIRATERHHGNFSTHTDLSSSLGKMNFGFQSMHTVHPHSLPELHDGLISGLPFSSLSTISPMHTNMNCRIPDGIDNPHFCRIGAGCINSHSFEHKEAFGVSGNGSYSVNGQQYVLNNSSANFHQLPGSLPWRNLPLFMNSISAPPPPQSHGLPRGPAHLMNSFVPLHHHHVGSDPALKPSLWEKCSTYARDSFEVPFHPASVGSMGLSATSPIHSLGIPSQNMYPHTGMNYIDPLLLPAHVGSPSLQQRSHLFHGRNSMTSAPASYDTSGERIRSRRNDSSAIQADNNKQFELDVDRIVNGEDSRTTLMIKNIPNKYTSKMLLSTIDEQHKGSYDFIYLPIDFKNKCNVGYAFINLTDPKHIIPFYQAFNGKKWEKFNSEKVASLAYARIQGKAALISHFQNSSLMNEDKRCRPILFHSDGPNAGGQEPFPMGTHIRSRPGRSKTFNSEDNCQASPSESDSGNVDEQFNSTESPSSLNKDSE